MTRLVKIICLVFFLLLILFAAFAEAPFIRGQIPIINLAFYLRLVTLAGLIIAVFLAWGFKCKIEATQKYRRAQEVLAQAETVAERKQKEADQLSEKLQAEFARKENAWLAEKCQLKADFDQHLMDLKKQNMQLKEAVSNLLQTLKKKDKREMKID